MNTYGYVGGDPVNGVDPDGLLWIPFTDIWIPAGEGYGDSAAQSWAQASLNPANSWYQTAFDDLMGGFASLWTPCTSTDTAQALSAAYGARVLGPFSPKGVPRYLQRARKYLRFDPPHHGKGWEFDGKVPQWLRRLGRRS